MRTVTVSEARANLASVLDQVHDDRQPTLVTRPGGRNAVIVDAEEWSGIEETLHLLRGPANAARLRRSLEQARGGQAVERELVDDDE